VAIALVGDGLPARAGIENVLVQAHIYQADMACSAKVRPARHVQAFEIALLKAAQIP
jgi:hypothetical protein